MGSEPVEARPLNGTESVGIKRPNLIRREQSRFAERRRSEFGVLREVGDDEILPAREQQT